MWMIAGGIGGLAGLLYGLMAIFSDGVLVNDAMLASGSVMVGVGAILVGLLAVFFRNPEAPRWARPEVVAMLAAVVLAGVTVVGLGYTFLGAYRVLEGTGDVRELVVLAAVLVLLAIAWRKLEIGEHLRATDAAGTTPPSNVVAIGDIGGPPRSPTPAVPPRRRTRKAA